MLQAWISEPRLDETEFFDVAVAPWQAYETIRHFDAGRSPLIHALFSLRLLPEKLAGRSAEPVHLGINDLAAPAGPGFRMLADEPEHGFVIGAIARPWQAVIDFADAPDFQAFAEPGWAKIAWSIRCLPRGHGTRVVFELRVATTDADSWPAMRRYYRLIGPFSRLIRRHLFHLLEHELGDAETAGQTRLLPGDERLPGAKAQDTYSITLKAAPEAIWPWLVQMGYHRGGWYTQDWLDNGGQPGAEAIVPAWQSLAVGSRLPVADGEDGFEVLELEAGRSLVLASCYDLTAGRQQAFDQPRPESYWRMTWAFVLEALGPDETRLLARVRVDYAPERVGLRLLWLRPLHALMQQLQLQHLRQHIQAQPEADGPDDVLSGLGGAARMLTALLSPFLIPARSHWGLSPELAARTYAGDELIPEPDWDWAHGVEIAASAAEVWPWVAQIGQDKGGFYSYQWLENLVGCQIHNADTLHADWQGPQAGDGLSLHPQMPPLRIVSVTPGRSMLALAALDPQTGQAADPASPEAFAVSWLFLVEELSPQRCRLISRYRCRSGPGLAAHLTMGPWLLGAISFVMDRKMLLGVRARAEAVS